MAIRCRDIIQLPSLSKIKVIAGSDGLDRIIRWVHVVDIPHVTQWVQGSELLFITGIGIKSDANALTELIREVEAKKLAGLVINSGAYIKEIPDEAIELANSLSFPVFELPWEVKLVDVTREICSAIITEQIEEKSIGHLLEDIFFTEYESAEGLVRRALFYNFDLTAPCRAAVADIDNFAYYLESRGIKDEVRILELKNHFKQIVLRIFAKYNKKILCMLRSDSVIMIVAADREKAKNDFKYLAEQIKESVSEQLPGLTVSVGLGNCYSELKKLRKSLEEAELVLKAIKFTGSKICSYNELGVYRLLFKSGEIKELESFYRETLGALLDYDKQYGTDFTKTLEAYLSQNCSITETAIKLNTHRNTLKYRLKRIVEISGCDLHNAYDRLNLQVGLLIGTFICSSK